MNINT